MKQVIIGIFAHPDDESFILGGYFLQQVREHDAEVHLVTLTLGQNGANPDNVPDLGTIREQEWREAGRLIGATSQHDLGFMDGHLDNLTLLEIVRKLEVLLDQLVNGQDVEVRLVTFDFNGITGHIDHIVAARATALVFYRRAAHDARFKELLLACIPETYLSGVNTDWLFMEPGRAADEIDMHVDATAYHDEIVAIMRAHNSQRGDGEAHIAQLGGDLGRYSFIVKD